MKLFYPGTCPGGKISPFGRNDKEGGRNDKEEGRNDKNGGFDDELKKGVDNDKGGEG